MDTDRLAAQFDNGELVLDDDTHQVVVNVRTRHGDLAMANLVRAVQSAYAAATGFRLRTDAAALERRRRDNARGPHGSRSTNELRPPGW